MQQLHKHKFLLILRATFTAILLLSISLMLNLNNRLSKVEDQLNEISLTLNQVEEISNNNTQASHNNLKMLNDSINKVKQDLNIEKRHSATTIQQELTQLCTLPVRLSTFLNLNENYFNSSQTIECRQGFNHQTFSETDTVPVIILKTNHPAMLEQVYLTDGTHKIEGYDGPRREGPYGTHVATIGDINVYLSLYYTNQEYTPQSSHPIRLNVVRTINTHTDPIYISADTILLHDNAQYHQYLDQLDIKCPEEDTMFSVDGDRCINTEIIENNSQYIYNTFIQDNPTQQDSQNLQSFIDAISSLEWTY